MWFLRRKINTNESAFFIINLFCGDCSIDSILREQFQLSRKANISIEVSEYLPDFEREIYMNLLISDIKQEREALNNK